MVIRIKEEKMTFCKEYRDVTSFKLIADGKWLCINCEDGSGMMIPTENVCRIEWDCEDT